MSVPIILPDANVLFTFSLRDTILIAAERELCRVRWSARVLEETRVSLVREGIMSEGKAANLIAVMQHAFPDAMITDYERFIDQMTNHPGDRQVAAAAWSAHVDSIVTFNLKHFPARTLAPLHLNARHPDDFLMGCFTHASDMMVDILREQEARRSRPPKSAIQDPRRPDAARPTVRYRITHAPRSPAGT